MNPTFCSQCGVPLQPEARFCPGCGQKVAATSTAEFARLRELYEQALGIDPHRRAAWVDQACAADPAMRVQLLEMLSGASAGAPAAPASPTIVIPQQSGRFIGPYRLVKELGRGGMGVVHLAERDDGAFRKKVALKELLRDQVTSEFVQRFKQERQVLAALDHPNIARILDGGDTPDGTPYYVMEYVEGQPIDRYCDSQKLGLVARIRLFQDVCKAVDYLHQNLVVHRDLKPSNIQVSASGVVKLLDFGIAKMFGAAAVSAPDLTTGAGSPMTPNYASPEQLMGSTLQTASDIYSLGVILYRLLTGRHPYEGMEAKMAHIAMRRPPTPPSRNIREDLDAAETTAQLRRAVIGELDSIVLKSLEIDPAKRYQSAGDLADDLRRFLDGQSVSAHRANVAHRSVRLIKRKRIMLAVAAAFVLLAAFGGWQWYRAATVHREAAERELSLRAVFDELEAAGPNQTVEQRMGSLQKLKSAFQNDFAALAARRTGPSAERDAFLTRGIRYLDRMRETNPSDSRLALAVAETYQQLGLLQENTMSRSEQNNTVVINTYQKAVTILVEIGPDDPVSAAAQTRLNALNIRIGSLSGGRITARTFTTEAAAQRPAARPQPSAVSAAPPPEPSQVDQMPAAPAAGRAEVEERFIQVASRVDIAQQAIEPVRINLEASGQLLNADTSVAITRMHSSLDAARRHMQSGNFTAAKESLGAAEAFATRVLRAVGR